MRQRGLLKYKKCCWCAEETGLEWAGENTNMVYVMLTVHVVDWPFLSDGCFPVADNRDSVGSRSSAGLHHHIPQRWVTGPSCTEGQTRFHSSPAGKTKCNVIFHLDTFTCTFILKTNTNVRVKTTCWEEGQPHKQFCCVIFKCRIKCVCFRFVFSSDYMCCLHYF